MMSSSSPASRPLAVVTGASSGIGAALAGRLAAEGYRLLLVGRDAARLEAVAAELEEKGATVETRRLDLADAAALEAFAADLAQVAPDILVNNAGFGAFDRFGARGPAFAEAMIATNVTALTRLTAAVLPAMRARKSGRILQVASTGAFAPLPFSAVYGATKAYVLSFSEAVAEELSGSGVTITALCPGPTRTRFFDSAGMDGTRLFKGPMASAETVAACGYKAMMAGRRVAVVGLANQLLVASTRLAPRRLVAWVTALMLAPR